MRGKNIGSVNAAIQEVLPELKELSASNGDAQIKIAALEFSSGAKWLYDQPVESETFRWNDLQAGGATDFGEACRALNQKLSRSAFMHDIVGSYKPVIILLSDGGPTDDYRKGLDELKENKWFKTAIKIAIAIGGDANEEILKEFTGNIECVLKTDSPEVLKKMITFVSVRSSEIGSKSSNIGVESKQDEMIEQIKDFKKEELASVQDIQNGDGSVETQGW
jgi:uncharacterized protein YegL